MQKYGDHGYVLDTNIILSDVSILERIGENNLVIITETVLEEIDKFKNGNEDKNYQAREFARMLTEAEIIEKTGSYLLVEADGVKILLLENRSQDTVNDNKIIETVKVFASELDKFVNKIIFISNDINFRTKCLLKGFETQPLYVYKDKEEINFTQTFENLNAVLPNKEYFKISELSDWITEISPYATLVKIIDNTRREFLFYREDETTLRKIGDKYPSTFGIKPKNLDQKIFFDAIENPTTDIIAVDAKAGSGKTLIALIAALDLVKKGLYDKITYIRRTIISGDNHDELGFLPGTLKKKLHGYLYPLRDNIEVLIKNKNKKKKKWSKDEIAVAIDNFENQFNINYEYEGHLRGRTIDGIIIIDEAQNDSIAGMKTMLSRVREGSKVIIIGSTRQIDHPYLNKYNNALTFMLKHCNVYNPVRIQGWKMDKIERGKIVEWVENIE